MTLILTKVHLQVMTDHAEAIYPAECCGLLLGRQELAPDHRWVHELRPLENQWTPEVNPFDDEDAVTPVSQDNRYWIDPRSLMTAQRDSRDRGWIILGVYHSHPDAPAVPSERDRQLAWSGYSYPILSVVKGQVAMISSWRLDSNEQFSVEAIATQTSIS